VKLRSQITDQIQAAGSALGVHITRAENTFRRKRQSFLRSLGVDLVIDVGANNGGFATEVRSEGYAGDIVSFEPIEVVFGELSKSLSTDKRWRGFQMALGDHDGSAEIHVSENLVSSSLRTVTQHSMDAASPTRIQRMESIRVAQLDTLQNELIRPSNRVYLKVDVQGFEKEVLSGARNALSQVVAIELELSLVELYSGQSLIHTMLSHVADLGFHLIWIERGFKDPVSGHLLQVDGIFTRSST
jgi:FkbM family methyltransferase